MSDKLLNLDEVCQVLDKTATTVKRFAKENLISSIEEGGELMFNEQEVFKYLEVQKRFER